MAELKLRVSLDTSYLKGQISRLPLEFAGANVSIRPKFDRRAIASEFQLLNRYIGSKKFNIIINTNLEAEIKNADRLIKALGRVQQAASGGKGGLPIGTQVLSRTKPKGGFAAAEIKALFGAAVQGGLIDDKTLATTRAQMVAALGEIGRDSIAGLLNGLKSGDSDIQNAAKSLGNNLITSFKTVLGIASPSKEFKKLGEAAGQGFEQGLLKSIEIAEQSATRKMQRMLDRLARMVLMMGGMSGPEIGRQIAQARALPSLNFGATTPRTPVAIGPSSTGRALPAGADRLGLPGTSFASQKLLSGDLLTPSMKAAIRDAANEFVDNLRGSLNNAIREVNVRDLGRMGAPMLGGVRTAGFLPAGVGRSSNPYNTGRLGREGETRTELFARREREARMRSALRGVDIMGEGGMAGRGASPYSYAYRGARPQGAIVPYAAGGAIVPSASRGGGGGAPPAPPRGGGGGGGGGSFGGMQFNMPKLPGAGLVREIGQEFGFAAKQVLLFGTAYKALAFIQGFPAQVGDAVGALQTFRNTLGAISPSAEEAAASSQFILDVVDKYNTPIQSARDGFTKLYASMKPTGFSGEEIRDLFLGISQAAATFGMSADKVDRVNYAFAQMASKGQVMSEELKGQLGDVLPGAMGIFAEAAGFEGPEAITKFSKALEDGAYKGAAMKSLLTNVGIIMRKEFGPGAEGAARTFQGVINRMQNSFKLLYESFEPVAVGFLNSVVMPMTGGIKTLTDGFNAFFTGTLAKTDGGAALAQQLNNLKPSFEGIRENLAALIPSLQTFGKLLLSVAQLLTTLAGNPIVGFLAKVYANILLVNAAFTLLGGRILVGLVSSIGATIARVITLSVTMNALAVTTARAGTAAAGAASSIAGTQLQMLLLQRSAGAAMTPVTALLGSLLRIAAIGAIAVVLTIAISNMNELRDAEARLNRLRGARANSVAGPSGPRPVQTAQARFTGASRETIEEARAKQTKNLTNLTLKRQALERKLQVAQGENLAAMADANSASIVTAGNRLAVAQANLASINEDIKNAQEVLRLDPRNYRREAEISRSSTSVASTGTEASQKKTNLESYYGLQDTLAKNAADFAATQTEEEFRHKIELLEMYYDIQETRANAYQKDAIRFEREMVMIEARRQEARLKAQLEVQRAQASVAGGVTGGSSTTGTTGLLQGSTGISGGAHFHISRADGSPISEQQARALLDPAVRSQVTKTSDYGPRRAPVPGASTFHRGVDLAGRANTPLNLAPGYSMVGQGEAGGLGYAASIRGPQGEMYKVGHLQRPAAGAGAPRKVPGSEKRDAVAEQKTLQASIAKTTTERMADAKAVQEQIVALEKYRASAFPTIEQETQNKLLARRNELIRSGMTDEQIEQEIKLYENQQRGIAALDVAKKLLDGKIITQAKYNELVAIFNRDIATSNKLLDEQNTLLKDNAYQKRIADLKEQIKLLLIVNTEERRLAELTKEFNGDKIKAQEIFNLEKIKKNIEDTRALIDGFVSSTASDYKGFLKAVISGEDAVDALKQFQEGLTDKVLTIFLDFAMAPVEKFLKEGLENLFLRKAENIPGLNTPKEATTDPVEATNVNTSATNANTEEIKKLTTALSTAAGGQDQSAGLSSAIKGIGLSSGIDTSINGLGGPEGAGLDAASIFGNPEALKESFAGIQSSIGSSMDGIVSSFESGSASLAGALPSWSDALTTKLPEALTTSTNKTAGEIPNFQESLGKVAAGIGVAAGAIMGIAAGIGQIKKGGTSNVLGGIGSILMGIGGGIGGFLKLAGANGGVADGGWKPFPIRAFANGGMVNGPTLGLVGEGKYNEAIVPLPDGRSIPVQFNQQPSLREAMAGRNSNNASSPSVLSMTFESTSINGVEYVSRDQLEAAMAETRRNATRDGASRGMTMTLDRIQNSNSTRRRIGV